MQRGSKCKCPCKRQQPPDRRTGQQGTAEQVQQVCDQQRLAPNRWPSGHRHMQWEEEQAVEDRPIPAGIMLDSL